MDGIPPFCADRRLDGPFTFGRRMMRAVIADDRPTRHAKEELVRAFVSPAMPVRPGSAPLQLSIHHAERLQILPQRHVGFLCHAVAEVLEFHWPTAHTVSVCHVEDADETDRELIRVMNERAHFEGRPAPVHIVDSDHPRATTRQPDAGEALLEAVRLGFYEEAIRHGRFVIGESTWPRTFDRGFRDHLNAYANALTASGRALDAVMLHESAAPRWGDPGMQVTAHYSRGIYHTRYAGPAGLDFDRAYASLAQAEAVAELIEDPSWRCRRLALLGNALALVDTVTGQLERAVERLDTALAELARSQHAETQHLLVLRNNRAVVLTRLGRLDDAIDDLDFAVSTDPAVAGPLVDRAVALQAAGRDQEALADLTRAIETCICGPEAYSNRAILLLQSGDFDAALSDLRWARLLDSSDKAIFIQLVETLLDVGRLDEAAALLAEWPLGEQDEQIIVLRARLAVARGAPSDALAVLNAGLRTRPEAALLRIERATVLHALSRPADALDEIDAVIESGHDDSAIEANRIFLLRECKRDAEARAAAMRLLESDLPVHVREYVEQLVA